MGAGDSLMLCHCSLVSEALYETLIGSLADGKHLLVGIAKFVVQISREEKNEGVLPAL